MTSAGAHTLPASNRVSPAALRVSRRSSEPDDGDEFERLWPDERDVKRGAVDAYDC